MVLTGSFLSAYWAIGIVVQLLVPVMLLAYRLPTRPHARLRAAGVAVTLVALAQAPLALGWVSSLDELESFLVFTGLLALFVLAICFVFDVRVWPALFCATAGYTLQNLASGLTLLLQSILMQSALRPLHDPLATIVSLGVPAFTYALSYPLLISKLNKRGLTEVENRLMLLMFVLVAVTVIGFDLIIKGLVFEGTSLTFAVLLRLVHIVTCVFCLFAEYELLYARRADDELVETERLLAERERQYQLSRENIEAINIKCHDIRHQIRHLAGGGAAVDQGVLRDIEREVNIYDSVVETGNEALNTILTEKSISCTNEGIELAVIADGAALGFMAPADIYALFGNALDNAIEAVRGIDDPERCIIKLSVAQRRGMVAINVENFCAVAPHFVEGLPQTTKADVANHGFGVRSMRAIAERYGGSLRTGAEDGIFYLTVVLNRPAATGSDKTA